MVRIFNKSESEFVGLLGKVVGNLAVDPERQPASGADGRDRLAEGGRDRAAERVDRIVCWKADRIHDLFERDRNQRKR